MTGSRWLAISVGTLVVALAFWFAILTMTSSPVTGLVILGVGLVFAMYSIAGFSGAPDPMGTGFIAALAALAVAAAVAVSAQAFGMSELLALSPVAGVIAGGIKSLSPVGDKSRNLARLGAGAAVLGALYFVLTVEVSAFGLMAPLLPLPAIGIADRFYDRGREVIDETV